MLHVIIFFEILLLSIITEYQALIFIYFYIPSKTNSVKTTIIIFLRLSEFKGMHFIYL